MDTEREHVRESRKKEKVAAKLERASRARQKAEEQSQREIVCKFDSHSVEQSALLGDLLARIITANQYKGMKTAFLLSGEVGSGKTELIRSIMSFATEQEVHMSSPSFLVVRDYELDIHAKSAGTSITIKHIDPHFMKKRLTNYVDLTQNPDIWFIEHAQHDGIAPLIRAIRYTCSKYCIINVDITAKHNTDTREFGLKFPLEWIQTGYEFCSTGSIPASLSAEYIGKTRIVSKTPSLHLRYYVQRIVWLKQWMRATSAKSEIIICAIETSFDDTCICLTRNGRIVWEKKVGQDKIHDEYGGVKPDVAANAHNDALNGSNGLIEQSKKECLRLCGRVPDLIAVTQGPGNALSLVPGILAAQRLAWNNPSPTPTPIIYIDHLTSHILTASMPEFGNDIKFPFLSFIVSGGHTFLVRVDSPVKCTVLWTTPNDTAGEALDKCAGLLDINVVPAAPKLEELARLGCGTRYADHFKSVETFSQLKICVRDLVAQLGSVDLLDAQILYDLMASTQTRAAEILASTLQSVLLSTSATSTTEYDSVVVAGGVMSNLEIRAHMAEVCRLNNIRLIVPPIQYCTDNAPMIANCAWQTIHHSGMTVEGLWEHFVFLNDGPEPEHGNVLQLSHQKFKGLKRGML
jgi:N6-L-threonylcarbamoyladenine synthase